MFSSGSTFTRCLEKATSQLLLEPDWDSVLQIVDCIRQGDVQAKAALTAIKRKISNENPHVSMFALQVLEACAKNCGQSFHTEIGTKEFMEFMKDQVKVRTDPVKEKLLELVQVWSHAFRNDPRLKAVEDNFHLLKMEGHKFPTLKEADAMFDAEKAPLWKDGDTCTRCRVQFGVVQRKHHCRNCGEVFCSKCTSKNSTIPKLGFEREVRVCDSCFDKINANKPSTAGKKEDDLPSEYLASPLSKQSQAPPTKTEQEKQEEEELKLAIALSKSEHESKEKERERLRSNYGTYGGGATSTTTTERPASPAKTAPIPAMDTSEMDPELARYLNRHYWQQKYEEQQTPSPGTTVSTTVPSAPAAASEARASTGQVNEAPQTVSSHLYQNGESESSQAEEQFLSALQGSLEIFVNRMRSNSQRGRPIANDSAVQSLFAVISDMHPQLMTHIQEKEEARGYFESLQDKLTQLRDARGALDSLREEHREKKRREAEELERLRQIQMMQKLEIMRVKKHEYLEMQRQLALQRLQEQEREMAARLEQQKQLTHMRQMQAYGYPQSYTQGMMGQPGMVPQGQQAMMPHGYNPTGGSAEGSPIHRVAPQGADGYHSLPPQQGMGPQAGMGPQPHMGQGQPGLYSMGQPVSGQYAMQGQGQGYLPPDGGQQTQGMMGHAGAYGMQPSNQGDQASMSMSMQPSMTNTMTSAPMGGYNAMSGQASTAGMGHQGLPALGTNETQSNYSPGPGGAPSSQPADYSSFNMQGLATSLPPQQNQPAMYNNQPQQQHHQPQQQQFASQPQQFPPQQLPQQQQQQQPQQQQQFPGQYQQPPIQHHQQQVPPEHQEVQLISFD